MRLFMEQYPPDNLKEIILKNQEVLEKIEHRIDRIERHFTWNTIFGLIKAVVIIGPIVIGVIYLSPLVKGYVDKVRPFLETLTIAPGKDGQEDSKPVINMGSLSPQMRNVLCDRQIREALIQENCPSN